MFASLKRSLANPYFWKVSKSATFGVSNHFTKKIAKNPFVFQVSKTFSSQNMPQEERLRAETAFRGYLELGKNALIRSDFQIAESEFRKAIAIGTELYGESAEYLAACYFSVGNALNQQGKRDEGREFILRAHKILSQNPQKNRKQLITIEKVLGIPAEQSKITQEGIQEEKEKILKLLALYQFQNKPENEMKIAKLYISLGSLCKRQGNKSEAISYKKKLTTIFEQHPNMSKSDLFLAYLDLGIDCKENKQFDEALGYFKKAMDSLSKQKTEGSDDLKSLGLQNIGHVHFAQQNFEEAIKFYSQALEIKELAEVRDEELIRTLNFKLGVSYFSTKNAKQAIRYFEKALEAPQETGDEVILASLFKYLGESYIQLEGSNSEKGKRHLERSESIKQSIISQVKPELDALERKRNELQQNIEAISK